jgi:hypothetical protein
VRTSFAAAFALVLGTIPCAGVGAETAPPALRISVEPLVVQFAVAPGEQAGTRVRVKNVGTDSALVAARAVDWYTTLDGNVLIERSGTQGESSLNPFLRLSAKEFTLAPGEAREMTLSLVLPPAFSPVPRDYWGGLFIRAIPLGAPATTAFGVGANILAYETVGTPRRHVKLTSLHVVDAGDGKVRVVGRLLNDGGTYARPAIRMQLARDGRIVQTIEDGTPAIFAGQPRLYGRTLSRLDPGAYQLQLTIDYGGASLVQGTTSFTVR